MDNVMRHLDLFSGIGGFALAATWVWKDDYEPIAFVELDEYCQRVLRRHWHGVPIHSDIREIRGERFGPVDLLTGGFPCQPFSVAGKQKGKADDRYLWPEMLRVIGEARPAWILAENVPGLIRLGLDTVLFDLEAQGYTARALVVPACGVDAPHRRDRFWIIAHADGEPRNKGWPQSAGQQRQAGTADGGDDVAHTSGPGCEEQHPASQPTQPGYRAGSGNAAVADVADAPCRLSHGTGKLGTPRRNEPADSSSSLPHPEGQQTGRIFESGFPAHHFGAGGYRPGEAQAWPAESGICRVAHGIPNRVDRLRALGNAIVPQVAANIMEFIKETMLSQEEK